MIGVEMIGDQSRGSMCAVCRSESVVHIHVGIRSQCFGELFLRFLHRLFRFGYFFGTRFFGQPARLAFFFGIETEVFEQQRFARAQRRGFGCRFFTDAVVGKLYIHSQQFRYAGKNMFQGVFISRAFRTSQMRADNDTSPIFQYLLKGRYGRTDTGVVGNVQVFVQRNVKIHTNKCLLSGKIKIVNCLHNYSILVEIIIV